MGSATNVAIPAATKPAKTTANKTKCSNGTVGHSTAGPTDQANATVNTLQRTRVRACAGGASIASRRRRVTARMRVAVVTTPNHRYRKRGGCGGPEQERHQSHKDQLGQLLDDAATQQTSGKEGAELCLDSLLDPERLPCFVGQLSEEGGAAPRVGHVRRFDKVARNAKIMVRGMVLPT